MARWMRGSTSSTPPTSTRPASRRRSSAGRSRAAVTTSCWPPSSGDRWVRTPTTAACHAAGSSPRSRIRCGAWARTGSTYTRCTAPIRTPTSTRPSVRSPTSSTRARSATSARPHSPPARSSRRSGRDASGALNASVPSSRRTRCWSAGSSSTCCPRPAGMAWASSPTARWPAAGCREAGAPTAHPPPRRGSGWPRALTCRWRRTSASSQPSRNSRRSPTRPACRSSSWRSRSSSITPP
jgi:hypothetical protein